LRKKKNSNVCQILQKKVGGEKSVTFWGGGPHALEKKACHLNHYFHRISSLAKTLRSRIHLQAIFKNKRGRAANWGGRGQSRIRNEKQQGWGAGEESSREEGDVTAGRNGGVLIISFKTWVWKGTQSKKKRSEEGERDNIGMKKKANKRVPSANKGFFKHIEGGGSETKLRALKSCPGNSLSGKGRGKQRGGRGRTEGLKQ